MFSTAVFIDNCFNKTCVLYFVVDILLLTSFSKLLLGLSNVLYH